MAEITDYSKVIGYGDAHSEKARVAVQNANSQTSLTKYGLIDGTGIINTQSSKVKGIITSIDGVGTKVQIYTNVFNKLVDSYNKGEKTKQDYDSVINQSIEIWELMLHDLLAMNFDDLRNGEMGLIFTNIVDVNHLDGIRGEFFTNSFNQALGNVIKELDINGGNGETAWLGESQKFIKTVEDLRILLAKELIKMRKRHELKKSLLDSGNYTKDSQEIIQITLDLQSSADDVKSMRKRLAQRMEEIEFNIGGTVDGYAFNEEKLVEMKTGQKVITFYETPENGIIGPRSNGITRIRELMYMLAGEGWETLSFEEFLEQIGEERASKVPDQLKQLLFGKQMWRIATGKTTVFNPFISRVLLGGRDLSPIVGISSLMHVTGNPMHKIANGIKDERFMIKDDMSESVIPQIIQILQHVLGIADDGKNGAVSSWNMGAAYKITCNPEDVDKILELAKLNNISAAITGEVVERNLKDNDKIVEIKGIGIGKTTVEKREQIDRDLPTLPDRYKNIHSGKVRETFQHPDDLEKMILVATDRISTHDNVHKSLIEGKGEALTQISNYWFDKLKNNPSTSDIKTHMVENPIWPEDFPEELKQKSVIVKKVTALPIEAIVRGYLYGSALKGYNSETGRLKTGEFIGKDLKVCSKMPEEYMFTPSTKSDGGDVNVDFDGMAKHIDELLKQHTEFSHLNAYEISNKVKQYCLAIYDFANQESIKNGDIILDTKFELGLDEEGNLVLIDEVLTPDSSRYMKADSFQEGQEPTLSDKQYVRKIVEKICTELRPRLDKKIYPITLPKEVIEKTQEIYARMRIRYSN